MKTIVAQQDFELQNQLQGHIDQLACGRIENLRVACLAGKAIILSGLAPNYHIKQLAQEAVFAFDSSLPLTNTIVVARQGL